MRKEKPSPPPPSVFDATVARLVHDLAGGLRVTYAEVWRDTLTSPSGQGLNVKVPTTKPTEETYLSNRSTRDALFEAHRKLEEASALIRSARAMISSHQESFNPSEKRKAEGASLTEQELHEMETRAKSRPSPTWERTPFAVPG